MTIYLIACIAFAVTIGIVASRRGRIGFGWFLLTLALPLAGTVVFALPRQPVTTGSNPVASVLKWTGIIIVGGCLTFAAYMALGFLLIVQHGGG
jgi:hypothetical protein